MSLKTFATQFLVGGSIIGTTSVIAESLGTKWAALFWSIPFSFMPVLIMLKLKKKDWQNYVSYSMMSSILLISTFIGMYVSIKMNKNNFSQSIILGVCIWTLFAILYLIVICPSPINKKCINLTT